MVDFSCEASATPWYIRFRSSPTYILLTVCVAIFNDVFLFGTIIPILPYALPERVNVAYDDVQIYIAALLAAYGGALLISSLLFGWLGDRVQRRYPIFIFGLFSLLGATITLALGRTIWVLIVGRLLQGTCAAVVWTSGLGLLTDLYGQERYGETLGYANMAVSVGTTSAPLLGGLVYSRGGYGAVSIMSACVVGVALIMGLLLIEREPTHRPQTLHNHTNGHSAQHTRTVRNGSVYSNGTPYTTDGEDTDEESPLLTKQTTEIETPTRKTQPAYGLLLKSSRILAAMGGIFTFSFVMISLEGMIPMFVKDLFGWSSAEAAMTYLAWIVPSFLGPLAGKASDRYGSRWVAVFGLLFTVPPIILLRLVDHDSGSQKVLLCAMLSLTGFGFVWVQPACMGDLTTAADELKRDNPEDFGSSGASSQAFGLFVFSYSCGCLVGPTVAGVLKARVGWGAATLILGMVCVLTCIPIILKTSTASRNGHKSILV